MAIYSTTQRIRETAAGSESDGSGSGSMDTTRVYDVLTSPDASEWEVLTLSATPKRGHPHPDNPFLRVRNTRVERLNPTHWVYYADFGLTDNGTDSSDPSQPIGNPLLQPAIVRYGHEEIEEEVDEGATGVPLVNVNFEPFARTTRPFGYRLLTIEKNVASFNSVEKDEYFFVTNSDSFLGYQPGRLLCKSIDAEPITDGPFTYYKQTATIASRTQGRFSEPGHAWYWRFRQEGFLVYTGQKDANDKPIFKHAEKDGDKVAQPVMLDGGGYALTDQSDALWTEFKKFQEKSFHAAGIL